MEKMVTVTKFSTFSVIYITDFFARNVGYHFKPQKVNGSSVESMFSQFKYKAGGKLTSINYETALRFYLMKKELSECHPSGKDYRDVDLHIRHRPLMRKNKKGVKEFRSS